MRGRRRTRKGGREGGRWMTCSAGAGERHGKEKTRKKVGSRSREDQ
jgi:hypothetical protein